MIIDVRKGIAARGLAWDDINPAWQGAVLQMERRYPLRRRLALPNNLGCPDDGGEEQQ
jgi:hypothetical protein